MENSDQFESLIQKKNILLEVYIWSNIDNYKDEVIRNKLLYLSATIPNAKIVQKSYKYRLTINSSS